MRKVPPSDVLREEIDRSLADGVQDGTDLLSHLAHLGLGYLVQQALEQEQEDFFLGRGRYERRGEGSGDRPPHRNGYEQGRLKTAEGEVSVRVPQVRGTSSLPYRSRLMEFLGGNSGPWSAWASRCTPGDSPQGTWRSAFGTSRRGSL